MAPKRYFNSTKVLLEDMSIDPNKIKKNYKIILELNFNEKIF